MKKLSLLVFLLTLMLGLQAQTQIFKFTVAKDGSGDFKTIQEAINKVRDHSQQKVTIFIKNGVYHEKLVIPSWKKNIALIGESKEKTIITNDDYSGKDFPGGDFTGNSKFSTYTSYTVLIEAIDCSAENLTIQNTAGRVGQAVALMVEADRVVIKNCNILGNQDTLYIAKDGRNYFKDCYIEGTTDFIFGEATVVFENCTIKSLQNSYVTAASTTPLQKFGFVFLNCELVAAAGVNQVYLGRPWRPYAKTVFIKSNLGTHILPIGWDPWKGDDMFPDKEKITFYAEYQNLGEGSNTSKRAFWSHHLKSAEAKKYTLKNIFCDWNPLKQ
ncbi:pectin esterase [Pedobacter psychrophilus]|uniref:Pectinesterase n=1 Tax=Pedobacter psychrophilus TaxID=1826909 RepID=A0A179DA40_9SPHI|nr:pectinesterase family protein [Pedobacter psychrophilus]OAQ37916.1 pectin esterase [Pedobacter psychrophilus]